MDVPQALLRALPRALLRATPRERVSAWQVIKTPAQVPISIQQGVGHDAPPKLGIVDLGADTIRFTLNKNLLFKAIVLLRS